MVKQFYLITAMEDDSPPGTPGRRDSSPEIETPPKELEMQSPADSYKVLERSISKIDTNVHFAKKQKGTIDVWWLFDDGGRVFSVILFLFEYRPPKFSK